MEKKKKIIRPFTFACFSCANLFSSMNNSLASWVHGVESAEEIQNDYHCYSMNLEKLLQSINTEFASICFILQEADYANINNRAVVYENGVEALLHSKATFENRLLYIEYLVNQTEKFYHALLHKDKDYINHIKDNIDIILKSIYTLSDEVIIDARTKIKRIKIPDNKNFITENSEFIINPMHQITHDMFNALTKMQTVQQTNQKDLTTKDQIAKSKYKIANDLIIDTLEKIKTMNTSPNSSEIKKCITLEELINTLNKRKEDCYQFLKENQKF